MLLNDEEISKTIQKSLGDELPELGDYDWMVTDEDRAIAKAQLKKVVEWGNEECLGHPTCETTVLLKRECEGCWQALFKEIE